MHIRLSYLILSISLFCGIANAQDTYTNTTQAPQLLQIHYHILGPMPSDYTGYIDYTFPYMLPSGVTVGLTDGNTPTVATYEIVDSHTFTYAGESFGDYWWDGISETAFWLGEPSNNPSWQGPTPQAPITPTPTPTPTPTVTPPNNNSIFAGAWSAALNGGNQYCQAFFNNVMSVFDPQTYVNIQQTVVNGLGSVAGFVWNLVDEGTRDQTIADIKQSFSSFITSITSLNDWERFADELTSPQGLANLTSAVAIGAIDPQLLLAESGYAARVVSAVGAAEGRAAFVYDAAAGRYVDVATGSSLAAREIPWPGNNGFASSASGALETGTIIDRFGSPSGKFAGQPGATVAARGMAQGSEAMPYTRYKVLKPLPAEIGPAAPVRAFAAEGGATQYLFNMTISELVEQGFLEEL